MSLYRLLPTEIKVEIEKYKNPFEIGYWEPSLALIINLFGYRISLPVCKYQHNDFKIFLMHIKEGRDCCMRLEWSEGRWRSDKIFSFYSNTSLVTLRYGEAEISFPLSDAFIKAMEELDTRLEKAIN